MTFYVELVAIVGAAALAVSHVWGKRLSGSALHVGGWVYFITPTVSDDERPAPIKIGMTRRDPAQDRIPEIFTMSPEPLMLLYSFYADLPEKREAEIHRDLAMFRLHGEWFERYPTLMYIDKLKEEG